MKRKKKNKILRFLSVFLIISILFVVSSFPISAVELPDGSQLYGLDANISLYSFINDPEEGYPIYSDFINNEASGGVAFTFDLTNWVEFGDTYSVTTRLHYVFEPVPSSNGRYGTLTFKISNPDVLASDNLIQNPDLLGIYDSSFNKLEADFISNGRKPGVYEYSITGYIPTEFYVISSWQLTVSSFELKTQAFYTFDISFDSKDPVADKLEEEKYPSFDDSQGTIDESQAIEDDSLNNANGFINNTTDFVFDRSLFTEGSFIKGLRVASTTFENFASIPFLGTILKYAVIFGLIGFVLGLATFVMRRRR